MVSLPTCQTCAHLGSHIVEPKGTESSSSLDLYSLRLSTLLNPSILGVETSMPIFVVMLTTFALIIMYFIYKNMK